MSLRIDLGAEISRQQEKGSMLCAQHSLNAILQGDYVRVEAQVILL
jgi:hypothetical protein